MGRNVFSVPIFFIVFRETLEAAIIVSVLCSLVEQIAHEDSTRSAATTVVDAKDRPADAPQTPDALAAQPELESPEDAAVRAKRFIRRMRWQIFSGSLLGLLIAIAIGAAFIAVWFTKAADLWAKSEELWEGTRPSYAPAATLPLTTLCRYLRADRVHHDLRHGRDDAQNGPRQG